MMKVLKWPTPPFPCVLKLVVELFWLKSVRFARYRRFGVFVFNGHFVLIAMLVLMFGHDLPPHFQVFRIQWCKKIPLHYHRLEDMGGFDFSVSRLTFPVFKKNSKFGGLLSPYFECLGFLVTCFHKEGR
jgi:hypothetical protein